MEETQETPENENENENGTPEVAKKQLGDKIFGAHNNPTKDNDYNDSFDIDQSHNILSETYDEEDYLHRKKLEELVYEAFQTSRWFPLSYKKKIPKDLVPHLFQEILEKLEDTEYSFSEKFVSICDYVQIPYAKAYEITPIKYKEMIINELEVKYSILSKRKIRKLF
jgi:hypothetical protein